MKNLIKRTIKNCTKKLGYEITKTGRAFNVPFRFLQWIKTTEDLYREFLFKEYPPYSSKRIELMSRLLGTNYSEVIYIVNYLYRSIKVDGDICEFGVAQGRTSALLAHEILHTQKNIWLFDSFTGLPRPSEKDKLINDIFKLGSIERYEGVMSCSINMVNGELNRISFPSARIKIVPGFIEKTLNSSILPLKVCFAYVDLDFYEPTLMTLNFLDKVLQNKGFIVIDDYDYFSTGVKIAVNEFIDANREKYKFLLPIKLARKFCMLQKNV